MKNHVETNGSRFSCKAQSIYDLKTAFLLFLGFAMSIGLFGQTTQSKTNNTPGTAAGNSLVRTVNFASGDFTAGSVVSDVNVTITWDDINVDPLSSISRHNETMFLLTSPQGTAVHLILDGFNNHGHGNLAPTYNGQSELASSVKVTFDHTASTPIGQPVNGTSNPISGTFLPDGRHANDSLNRFNGENPIGNWRLTALDHAAGNGDIRLDSFTVLITVCELGTITNSPLDTTVCQQETAYFSFTRSGPADSIFWFQAPNTRLIDGPNISNATTLGLYIHNVTSSMNGYQYFARMYGCAANQYVQTSNATLTIDPGPTIDTQPVPTTVCNGQPFTFTANSLANGVTYQWQEKVNGQFSDISGETAGTFTGTGDMNNDGSEYRCLVMANCTTITNTVMLSVISTIGTISTGLTMVDVCPDGHAMFNSSPSASGFIDYTHWQVSTDAGVTWINVMPGTGISGISTHSLSITPAPLTLHENQYRNALFACGSIADSTDPIILYVQDTIKPSITCPPDDTVSTDSACIAFAKDYRRDAITSDNCDTSPVTSQGPSPNSPLNYGQNTITLTVTDSSANQTPCTFTVLVLDSTPPVPDCKNVTTYLDTSGTSSITLNDVDNGSADNCSPVTLMLSQSTFTCSDQSVTVQLTATDTSGNQASCSSIVTVLDSFFPIANCQDITVNLDSSGMAYLDTLLFDSGSTDNCDLSRILDPPVLSCGDSGTSPVKMVVEDNHGNKDSCLASVTIIDNTPPIVVCGMDTVYLDSLGQGSLTFNDLTPPSNTSQIDILIRTDNFPEETFWMLVDSADSLVDSVRAGHYRNFQNDSIHIQQILPCGQEYHFYIHDAFGDGICCNLGTGFFEVRRNGALIGSGGTFTTQDTVDINLDPCPAVTTDNCSMQIANTTVSPTTFDCSDIGLNTVTIITTDFSSNSDTCVTDVWILDEIAPVAHCRDFTFYLDSTGAASITATAVDSNSSDNCSIAPPILSQNSWTCLDLGNNTTTLTVSDSSGNQDSCHAQITIRDTIFPQAVCQNINVYLDTSNTATITPVDVDGGSSDNCSMLTYSINRSLFSCLDLGPQMVTLTVEDPALNSSSCIATVIVIDSTLPEIQCHDTTLTLPSTGIATISASDLFISSSDNCAVERIEISQGTFDCLDVGVNPVNVIAYDSSGNAGVCPTHVTIEDTFSISAAFTFTVASNGVLHTFTDQSTGAITSWNWTFGDGIGSSNSQNPSYTYPLDSTVKVTLIVSDGCRMDTATQLILVTDLDQLSSQGFCTIYPNPNKGSFTISLKGVQGTSVIEIYDVAGKVILKKDLGTLTGNHRENLILNNPYKGLYFVKVTVNETSIFRKVLVQ